LAKFDVEDAAVDDPKAIFRVDGEGVEGSLGNGLKLILLLLMLLLPGALTFS
jgi:hypothetical protein